MPVHTVTVLSEQSYHASSQGQGISCQAHLKGVKAKQEQLQTN